MARFSISNSSVDDLRDTWSVCPAAAVLDSISITQPLHTTSIKEWMGSSAISAVHQWVSCPQSAIHKLQY